MQVFRLVGGPDKVIAFDSLPKRLLSGFETIRADAFPRHWKEWMGKTERVIRIPPERDPITAQVRTFPEIVEKDHFFYLVDWQIGPVVEKWKEVCEFVKTHVTKDTTLKERLEDMALPLAGNLYDSVTLEPDEVVIIPIPEEFQEKDGAPAPRAVEVNVARCSAEGCTAEFEGQYAKNALRMHTQKKHKAVAV
jgi:hypothetical protein